MYGKIGIIIGILLLTGCGIPPTWIGRGSLIKIERDERYEPMCSILRSVRGQNCENQYNKAFHGTIQVDSTRVGKPTREQTFMFFVQPEGEGLQRWMNGELYVWMLARNPILELSKKTYIGCPMTIDYVLPYDKAIRNNWPSDSTIWAFEKDPQAHALPNSQRCEYDLQ